MSSPASTCNYSSGGEAETAIVSARTTPRGRRAKPGGTPIKRGRGISFTTYPRPKTKALLVEAAAADNRKVANYVLHRAMVQLSKEARVPLDELLPKEEYEALVLKKFK